MLKKAVYNSCQVVIELAGRLVNHLFALSIKENGNRIKRIASGCTPFILKVEQYSKNLDMCPNGSSCGSLLNGEFEGNGDLSN